MTFPSLRQLLYVAPVLAAVGIAAACGPYGQPGVPPPAGISMPGPARNCSPNPPPIQPPPLLSYPQANPPAPPSVSGTSLSVLDGKIHMQTADGARMICDKLTIVVNGVEPAEVCAVGKEIRIASGKDVKDGDFLQATAQKLTRTATDGAELVLEGDVKLHYVRKGKKIEVSTDLLSVNLLTGQVISEMDAPKVVTPIPTMIQPVQGTTLPPGGSGYPVTPGINYGPSSLPAVTENDPGLPAAMTR